VLEGLVDFRSWCDGEVEVMLCWKLGEPEIRYYHGLDDGFSARKPIKGHRFSADPDVGELGLGLVSGSSGASAPSSGAAEVALRSEFANDN
jgi:hypothetical protein